MPEQAAIVRLFAVEALGTALLVGLGIGGCEALVTAGLPPAGWWIGLVWALAVVAMAAATMPLGGACANPAVAAAQAAAGLRTWPSLAVAAAGQLAGALIAAALLRLALGGAPGLLAAPAGPAVGALAEAAGTGMLAALVVALERARVPTVPAVATVALVLAGIIAATFPLSHAGLNPARDLGPRLCAAGAWQDGWWLAFILAPLAGALIAARLVAPRAVRST
jgi:glycerol uptake facilitator protein